jgi:hypothetical protein
MVMSGLVLTEAYNKLPIKLWYGTRQGGSFDVQGVDPDPSEQTCPDFKPRNYHEMHTNFTRMVSDLLRFVCGG